MNDIVRMRFDRVTVLLMPVMATTLSIAAPAWASDAAVAPQGETIRLTPAQIEEALQVGGTRNQAGDGINGDGVNYITPPSRRIHGEMGMMIGTGGARGLYGATEIPLGDSATAGFAFSTERYGRRGWGY